MGGRVSLQRPVDTCLKKVFAPLKGRSLGILCLLAAELAEPSPIRTLLEAPTNRVSRDMQSEEGKVCLLDQNGADLDNSIPTLS